MFIVFTSTPVIFPAYCKALNASVVVPILPAVLARASVAFSELDMSRPRPPAPTAATRAVLKLKKTLESLPKEGIKNVLAICPGFSSDCVETLEEILIQGKESFIDSGGANFDMVPCLNDNEDHISLLKSLIQNNI